ncbi:hypothetical protein DUI87_15984 [Hirundo rustica rustica]|uniref:Uncharacterized protein n=1 Tax=Hirundo rustica rustica TaxID=333673 RepID=A0A3M0KHB2_HIRRU|nr:hypothetical protein DUI87_15984 [Hirundo rustica rustica]
MQRAGEEQVVTATLVERYNRIFLGLGGSHGSRVASTDLFTFCGSGTAQASLEVIKFDAGDEEWGDPVISHAGRSRRHLGTPYIKLPKCTLGKGTFDLHCNSTEFLPALRSGDEAEAGPRAWLLQPQLQPSTQMQDVESSLRNAMGMGTDGRLCGGNAENCILGGTQILQIMKRNIWKIVQRNMYKQPFKTSIENAVSREGLDCPGTGLVSPQSYNVKDGISPLKPPPNSPVATSARDSKTTVKTLIVQGKGEIIGTVREEGKDVGVDPLSNSSENYFTKN